MSKDGFGNEGSCARISEDVLHVVGFKMPVDWEQCETSAQRCFVTDHPLGSIGGEHRNHVTWFKPMSDKGCCKCVNRRFKFAVSDRLAVRCDNRWSIGIALSDC